MKIGHNSDDKPITIDSPFDLKKIGWTTEQINEIIHESLIKKRGD